MANGKDNDGNDDKWSKEIFKGDEFSKRSDEKPTTPPPPTPKK